MIIDNHVHVGWYIDGYHSPSEIWAALESSGISKAAVSSTSTCAELYHNVETELLQLYAIAGKNNILPLLWISPKMIQKKWPLKKLLSSKIEWAGIKMHWLAHTQFYTNPDLANNVIELARQLGNIPILLHTGDWDCCRPKNFIPLIHENQDLKFILAHGRPIDETIEIMHKYSNVFVDTSFMEPKNIERCINENLISRVIFGSDAPINKIYFPELSTDEYILKRIEEIRLIDPSILNSTVY